MCDKMNTYANLCNCYGHLLMSLQFGRRSVANATHGPCFHSGVTTGAARADCVAWPSVPVSLPDHYRVQLLAVQRCHHSSGTR